MRREGGFASVNALKARRASPHVKQIFCRLYEMQRRNGGKRAAIPGQQFETGRSDDQMAGATIVGVLAPDDESRVDQPGQLAAYRRARTDIQKKKLFQRQWLPLLLRISDLDDDIEIDDGLEERELQPLIVPDFS